MKLRLLTTACLAALCLCLPAAAAGEDPAGTAPPAEVETLTAHCQAELFQAGSLTGDYTRPGPALLDDGVEGEMYALIYAALEGEKDQVDLSGLDPRLADCQIQVACDVTNPLHGPNGASAVFGPQKGATPDIVRQMDAGAARFAAVVQQALGVDAADLPGTGAAGGLGVALFVFLKAKMQSGIESMLELIEFDKKLEGVDLVVTGEGQTDWQSCFGKVMQGVGDHCKNKGIPAVALCGSLGEGYDQIYEHGISSLMTTVDSPMTVEHAMSEARDLYLKAAIRMFRFIKTGMEIRN